MSTRDIENDRLLRAIGRSWAAGEGAAPSHRGQSPDDEPLPPEVIDRIVERVVELARNPARSVPAPAASTGSRGRAKVSFWAGAVAATLVAGVLLASVTSWHRGGAQHTAAPLHQTGAAESGETAFAAQTTPGDVANEQKMQRSIATLRADGAARSPELAQLLDQEEAAIAAVVQRCERPPEACELPIPVVAGTLNTPDASANQIRRLFEPIPSAPSKPHAISAPGWLDGLRIPAIGVGNPEPFLRHYVEYYTKLPDGRTQLGSMLARCEPQRETIESALLRHGLPRELLSVAMVESGCAPTAEAPDGARGLWQLRPVTARIYRLRVDSAVDERLSPERSTEAALAYLADLYRETGSWELALTAYHMGPWSALARIRRAGGHPSFDDLVARGLLPEGTVRYVPRARAYALIVENLQHFGFATRAAQGQKEAP